MRLPEGGAEVLRKLHAVLLGSCRRRLLLLMV